VLKTKNVLQYAGYPPADCDRVAELVSKSTLGLGAEKGKDTEAQTLEDAACLVFFEEQAHTLTHTHTHTHTHIHTHIHTHTHTTTHNGMPGIL
jgi:hypothetical protein